MPPFLSRTVFTVLTFLFHLAYFDERRSSLRGATPELTCRCFLNGPGYRPAAFQAGEIAAVLTVLDPCLLQLVFKEFNLARAAYNPVISHCKLVAAISLSSFVSISLGS